jgi:anti-sigma regulatory factor (Ser/Thr protein kinase)
LLELSMHILDIVENSVTAGASQVSISVEENRQRNVIDITVQDNGRGMDKVMQGKATDPFVTTKERKKVGLGLPMFMEAAKRSGGELWIDSKPGKGTIVKATFGLNHVDRQPLGNIVETMVTLIVGHPDVEFQYKHIRDEKVFNWNTRKIQDHFWKVHLSQPELIGMVREEIGRGLENIDVHFFRTSK